MIRIHTLLVYIIFLIVQQKESYAQTPIPASQNHSGSISLYFRLNRSMLEKDYLTNTESMDVLRSIMTNEDILSGIDSIVVKASASPEGDWFHNQQLSNERAASVKTYLMWQYPYLDRDKIRTYSLGENWDELKRMVEADPNVPHRNEILTIYR